MASDRLVANASPLIFLASVEGLEWLARLSDHPVVVPDPVLREVAAGDGGSEIIEWITRDGRFSISASVPTPGGVAAWDLGAGESQVLAQCLQQPGAVAVLDDKAARECARGLGVRIIGTLGIVLVAKRRAWIPAARPVIDRLLAHGMFLAADLVAGVLQEAGE